MELCELALEDAMDLSRDTLRDEWMYMLYMDGQ